MCFFLISRGTKFFISLKSHRFFFRLKGFLHVVVVVAVVVALSPS